MAEHLPDDLRQWPDDPFRLLGVVPPVTEEDLKRAYTRLIRRFKPEHHPEQFRRVREAYETALQHLQWFGLFRDSPASEPSASPSPSTPTTAPPSESVTERAPEVHRPLPVIDPVEEAWGLALEGRRAEAYGRLIELEQAQPESSKLPLCLYWLLTIDPGLDTERSRHDWLAAALIRSRLDGPARELYRRELSANPEEALFGPYARLLEAQDVAALALLELARERLAAAGHARLWARLNDDLESLAEHTTEFDDAAWLSYLVDVMGYVAFEEKAEVYRRCSHLLGGLQHLELSQSWAFDRIDELKSLREIWGLAAPVPEPIRQLVHDAWTGSPRGWQESLVRASTWAADDPAHALYTLDEVAGDSYVRPFFGTLFRLLNDYFPRTSEYPPGLVRGLITAFLANGIRKDYGPMRPDLIRFLVSEAIDPEELINACRVDSRLATRSLVEHVRGDGVLWLVWRLATTVG